MQNKKRKKTDLWDLLLAFRRSFLENIKEEGLKYDLPFSQMEILHLLGHLGKETMKNIAAYLKITPPSATEIIAEMEKKGLVKRESDKNDRRVVFITLTSNAKKLSSTLFNHKDIILNKMISKLSEKDLKNLERIIRILITN